VTHLLKVIGSLLLELAKGRGLRLESPHRHAVVLHHLGDTGGSLKKFAKYTQRDTVAMETV